MGQWAGDKQHLVDTGSTPLEAFPEQHREGDIQLVQCWGDKELEQLLALDKAVPDQDRLVEPEGSRLHKVGTALELELCRKVGTALELEDKVLELELCQLS